MNFIGLFEKHWSDNLLDGDDTLYIEKAHNRPYLANSIYDPGTAGYTKDLELELSDIKSAPDIIFGDPVAHPFEYAGWGSSIEMINGFTKNVNTDNTKDRVDGNRLFQREISNIQNIQAEQQKINKLFENKLVEQLKDKGQFGVNEDITAGFQAYTAGKTAALNAAKELVAIRKAIAEITIKQNQAEMKANGAQNSNNQAAGGFDNSSPTMILDKIFELPSTAPAKSFDAPQMTPEEAGIIFGSDTSNSNGDDMLRYESVGAKTYVQVDAGGSNPRYVTLDNDGNEITDYPNPITEIKSVDVQTGKATNALLEVYDIIQR